MKIALVTTPPSVRSGIGDYTRHLLPYLRERAEVEVVTTDELDGLRPGRHDRILWQVGNETHHAPMARALPRLGGVVCLHDWVLFDLALATYPALSRGGAKGCALALREGGARQLATYARSWLDRRRHRARSVPPGDPTLPGTLLAGWHGEDAEGRWTADHALARLPGESVRRVAVTFRGAAGRRVSLHAGGRELAALTVTSQTSKLEAELDGADEPVLRLSTEGVQVTDKQRAAGDSRRLGVFVERLEWDDAVGTHELDLQAPVAEPVPPVTLSLARFELPLNRSVLRAADAFVVHSEYVAERVRRARGGRVPVTVIPHGAERRWHDEPRAETRRSLGLPPDWCDGFLAVSFGGVQRHKRIEHALRGLALARKTHPAIRLALVGSAKDEFFDARSAVLRLGLEDAVHLAGFVDEPDVHRWLHAGDVSINLRGPSTGGTSGGIYQSYAQGRAVLASDAAEQRELPDACTPKVPLGEGEDRAIATELVRLHDDAALRERLEQAARDYVERACHWSLVAERYAAALEAAPGR